MLALAGLVAVTQGGQNADGCIHAAHHIRDAYANLGRDAVGIARQGHDAAVALGHQIIARLAAVRAGLPKPGDRAIDKGGMGGT